MLERRAALLGSGLYTPVMQQVAEAVRNRLTDTDRDRIDRNDESISLVDLGCGTGHYTRSLVAAVPAITRVALTDRSPDAVRAAMRTVGTAAESTGVVLDLWRPLPLRDGSADVALDVFAPRNPDEFARVLRPGGALIVVVPTARHLTELREAGAMLEIPDDKDAAVADRLGRSGFDLRASVRVDYTIEADPVAREWIIGMGPSARHGRQGDSVRREASGDDADTLTVTVSVDVMTFQRP